MKKPDFFHWVLFVVFFSPYTTPSIIFAQAHPEMLDVSIDKGWHQTLDLYFDYYRGNVNQTNVSSSLTSSYHAGKHESMLEGSFWFGYFDREPVLNQINFTARHVRSLGKNLNSSPWSADIWAQVQQDNLIALDNRLASGVGIRREFVTGGGPDDPYDLYLATGFFHEQERFKAASQRDRTRIRWGNYITQTWEPNDAWLINLGLYLNVDTADPTGFRQLVLIDLLYAVGDSIYLSSKTLSRYDSKPGLGVQKFDLFTIFGLTYEF